MHKHLKSFFDINGLFDESHYGFIEKHSTEHALIDTINRIKKHGQRDVPYWSVLYRSEKGV